MMNMFGRVNYCDFSSVFLFFIICLMVSGSSNYVMNGSKQLISEFTQEQACGRAPRDSNDKPWHAAILKIGGGNGCFGTIISPRIILSVEVCIYTKNKDLRYVMDADANGYEVIVRDQKTYKVQEYYIFNKTGPLVDANRFHEVLVIVLKEKISFNSNVSPACVHWANPERMNVPNGVAKVVQGTNVNTNDELTEAEPNIQEFSISNHESCSEKWIYPYYVHNWAFLSTKYGNTTDETFLRKKNLFCLVLAPEQMKSFTIGSGVMYEEDNRYFIRGISGPRINVQEYFSNAGFWAESFKKFMDGVRYLSEFPNANLARTHPQWDLNEINIVYKYASLVKKHLGTTSRWSGDPQNIVGVIDIADYINWIKNIRDNLDS